MRAEPRTFVRLDQEWRRDNFDHNKAIVNCLVDTGNEKGRKSASMEMKEEEKGEKTLSVV